MTQIYTVQGPDGKIYDIEGPEGATAEQLGSVIQGQAPKESKPDSAFMRDQKLGLRSILTGLPSIGSVIADGGASIYNMVSDKPVQMPSQSYQSLLDKFLPRAETPKERMVQDVGAAASGMVGLSAPAMALKNASKQLLTRSTMPGRVNVRENPVPAFIDDLATSPKAQAAAAAASAAAAGAAREDGLGPLAQLGLGLGAGMLGTTGGSAVSALLRPRTVSGKEEIVGDVLRRFAVDPRMAQSSLNEYRPHVPNSQPLSGSVSNDTGLMSLQNTLLGLSGEGRNSGAGLADQFRQGQWAKRDYLASAAPKSAEDIRRFRDSNLVEQILTPMLRDRKRGVNTSDFASEIAKIDANPLMQEQGRQNAVKFARDQFEALSSKGLTDDPGALYGLRKNINALIETKVDPMKPNRIMDEYEIGALTTLRGTLDNAIEQGMPGFKSQFLKPYSKLSAAADRASTIETLADKSRLTRIADTNADPRGSYSQFVNAKQSAGKDLGKLTNRQQRIVENIARDFELGAKSSTAKMAGSDTFKNISYAHMLGRLTNGGLGENAPKWIKDIADQFSFMVAKPNEEVQALLMDAMKDPKLAERLLRNANQLDAKSLAQVLQNRSVAYATGVNQNTQ